jgi:hypothetical protein
LAESPNEPDDIDWSRATWEGARREQMHRWAALPLERMVAALEEMDQIAAWAGARRQDDRKG